VTREQLTVLLQQVRNGSLSAEDAVERLRSLPYEDLGFAKLDHHRALRKGFPEVVFCQNKTETQVLGIIQKLAASGDVLATRVPIEMIPAVTSHFPEGQHNDVAHTFFLRHPESVVPAPDHQVALVCCAGTSDLPVAEEAAVTVEVMGNRVERLFDVGVAGLHRLLSQRKGLQDASVLIVVAGMDGVLPTVVSGLVDRPVIAVPTSVGYGAAFEGLAPLLTMLNACSPGVVVVNIDNGFGAGYFASLILSGARKSDRS